jgi:hypothetical protein
LLLAAASAAVYFVQLAALLAFRNVLLPTRFGALSVHSSSDAARALWHGVRRRRPRALEWRPPARPRALRWRPRSARSEFCSGVRPRAQPWHLSAPPACSAVVSARAASALCRGVRPRRQRRRGVRVAPGASFAMASARAVRSAVASARRMDMRRLLPDAARRTTGPLRTGRKFTTFISRQQVWPGLMIRFTCGLVGFAGFNPSQTIYSRIYTLKHVSVGKCI